jgi:hypothetical protein
MGSGGSSLSLVPRRYHDEPLEDELDELCEELLLDLLDDDPPPHERPGTAYSPTLADHGLHLP